MPREKVTPLIGQCVLDRELGLGAMDTTIETVRSVRSHRTVEPDPARLQDPLADLADAAVQAAASGTVAITRGFDRNSRQRAKALRHLLEERDIAAIEVTPAPGSERLLAGTDVHAVINLVGAGAWQPYRLAVKLRAPVLAPRSGDGAAASETERDVICVTSAEGVRDAALSHVGLRPENTEASSLTITSDGESVSIPGGWVTIVPRDQWLELSLGGPDIAERTSTAQEVHIETLGGPYRWVRDELPIADFEGVLTFTAEPRGLVVRTVG
jgi:hypothetical protein